MVYQKFYELQHQHPLWPLALLVSTTPFPRYATCMPSWKFIKSRQDGLAFLHNVLEHLKFMLHCWNTSSNQQDIHQFFLILLNHFWVNFYVHEYVKKTQQAIPRSSQQKCGHGVNGLVVKPHELRLKCVMDSHGYYSLLECACARFFFFFFTSLSIYLSIQSINNHYNMLNHKLWSQTKGFSTKVHLKYLKFLSLRIKISMGIGMYKLDAAIYKRRGHIPATKPTMQI